GPLREAMQRLVSEGILHAIANRGVFVSELTMADMIDVYRTRATIEQAALDLILADRRGDAYVALGPGVEALAAAARTRDPAGRPRPDPRRPAGRGVRGAGPERRGDAGRRPDR